MLSSQSTTTTASTSTTATTAAAHSSAAGGNLCSVVVASVRTSEPNYILHRSCIALACCRVTAPPPPPLPTPLQLAAVDAVSTVASVHTAEPNPMLHWLQHSCMLLSHSDSKQECCSQWSIGLGPAVHTDATIDTASTAASCTAVGTGGGGGGGDSGGAMTRQQALSTLHCHWCQHGQT